MRGFTMKMSLAVGVFLGALFFAILSVAATGSKAPVAPTVHNNVLDDLDPFDPQIEQKLKQMDKIYEQETGQPSHLESLQNKGARGCVRAECPVWIQVVKSRQRAYLYLNGEVQPAWLASTGIPGRETPDFDKHPDGRIYDAYTSTKFPGGDYDGLGNMPYAVFISGGFAIHGTGQSNWPKLGHRASHGCIRVLPDNAYMFNRLVRKLGVDNVWITVQD